MENEKKVLREGPGVKKILKETKTEPAGIPGRAAMLHIQQRKILGSPTKRRREGGERAPLSEITKIGIGRSLLNRSKERRSRAQEKRRVFSGRVRARKNTP